MATRTHPAEKAGLWLPKDLESLDEQVAYVESDKGVLGDIMPLTVTDNHIKRGGYLRNDCALVLAVSEKIGYEVILVGEYLYPLEKIGYEPKYVDEAVQAALIWRRNYVISNSLYDWWKQDCRSKNWRDRPFVTPVTINLTKPNPFGVWGIDIEKEDVR